MLLAIVSEYDTDVRWKNDARAAQAAFARAAANSRVGSQQAYQNAKLRLEDLTEMVRGGRFNGKASTDPMLDWSNVVDRGTLMEMLEASFSETLKPSTANKTEMVKSAEAVLHQANLVAAMGQILTKEGMEEADEEDAPMTSPAGKGKVSLLFVAFRNVFLPTVWLVADRKHERFLRDDEFETLFFVILAPL